MKLIKRRFDENYFNTISDKFPYFKFWNAKVNVIHSLKSKGDLLEIGCGNGVLLGKLKEYFRVWGVDISPSAIAEAKQRVGSSRVWVADVQHETAVRSKFNIIIALDVLEHLPQPQSTIRYIRKLLKRDGVFMFSVPNNYGLYGKFSTCLMNYFDRTHISTYQRFKWIELITENGFVIDKIFNKTLFGIYPDGLSKYIGSSVIICCSPQEDL